MGLPLPAGSSEAIAFFAWSFMSLGLLLPSPHQSGNAEPKMKRLMWRKTSSEQNDLQDSFDLQVLHTLTGKRWRVYQGR